MRASIRSSWILGALLVGMMAGRGRAADAPPPPSPILSATALFGADGVFIFRDDGAGDDNYE